MRWLALLCLLFVSLGPTLRGAEAPGAPSITPDDRDFFEKRVRPLLVERCHKCHASKPHKQRGGLLLDSRVAILKGGDSGPAVVPGQPAQSLLIQAVRYQHAQLHMPPGGKLPPGQVAILEEWVRRSVPFPKVGAPVTARQGIDLGQGRKFWSFQPPRMVSLPSVRKHDWPRLRIDRFVLAELEKRNLAPSPPASRPTFIRRVTFDLIGLPPTPEEVEAFINDPAEDAPARLVERLLASPAHGERWGRFWLDLVRYCDVPEPWAETKGAAWLYRDWVVRAGNDDLPYDRFVRMQLAADLMPDAQPRDRAALGFLGLSPTYWKELKLDPPVIQSVVAEEWEERVQTISGTFLGLTVACARCHDHKFDPISTHDYYALAGVLASIRQVDRPLLPDAESGLVRQARGQAQQLQKEIDQLQRKKPLAADAQKRIDELKGQIEQIRTTTPHFDQPLVPAIEDASQYVLADGPHRTRLEYRPGVAQDVSMQVRGNPTNLGPLVPRGFLAVLSPAAGAPKRFTQGSGRLELAQALVQEGAPLLARVIVNRVWKHHFGSALVDTLSDFGAQGSRPTHPELLDDLAARFVQNGWSLKWLHREIVLSATYRQASRAPVADAPGSPGAVDPANRLLWRMNRRRLEIEAWRDAMLAVAGTLQRHVGGPPLDLGQPGNQRRTLYGTIKRRELHDLLRLHDVPDATMHSPSRNQTTTPLQQLFTLNSPFLQRQAPALVRRLEKEAPDSDEQRVQQLYRLLFGRPATAAQVKLALAFLADGPDSTPARAERWQQYAQALLGSNEFLFVD
jgi:hypothetical protein